MGKRFKALTPRLINFIKEQKMFFVATAMKDGTINLSPKGIDSFRVLDENSIVWLNLTGSGNETATHLMHHPRMTIMFCAFEGNPLILRLYGSANAYHPRDAEWDQYLPLFPKLPGSRQFIEMKVELVQTSCGMGVPYMDFKEERQQLLKWAEEKGEDGLQEYFKLKNTISLDGHKTDIFEDVETKKPWT